MLLSCWCVVFTDSIDSTDSTNVKETKLDRFWERINPHIR